MRIIKPYGRSIVEKTELQQRKILRGNELSLQPQPIASLMKEDKLVIAYWISAIDKILCKAGAQKDISKISNEQIKRRIEGENKNNRAAAESRRAIGAEAWELMKADQLLSVFQPSGNYKTEEERKKQEALLERLWEKKIEAPSPKKKQGAYFPKGRWYEVFAKGFDPYKIGRNEAESIAGKINKHLYEKAYKYAPEGQGAQNSHGRRSAPIRGTSHGVLENSAKAIAHNSLLNSECRRSKEQRALPAVGNIWAVYCAKAGDFAAVIYKTVLDAQKAGDETAPYHHAIIELKKIWPKLFGKARNYTEAKAVENGNLLDIHDKVKETYKNLLKGRILFHEKQKELLPKGPEGKEKLRELVCAKLAEILPENTQKFYALMTAQQNNGNLNGLIRLGKIIHYTASRKVSGEEESIDAAKDIVSKWPSKAEVESSFYWSSQGQAEIKQNEAFVRVWRRALTFAAHNLKNWIAPKGIYNEEAKREDDILFAKQEQLDKAFDENCFNEKYALLFGETASITGQETKFDKRALSNLAWHGIRDLRNAAFHFKGMGNFIKALDTGKEGSENNNFPEKQMISKLYRDDLAARQERLKASMEAASFHQFFGISQIEKIWQAAAKQTSAILPLPRLKRVLERAESAWNRNINPQTKEIFSLILPPYSTAQGREDSRWALCQYTAAKMLYDGAFNLWLQAKDAAYLKSCIDTALANTTAAARKMNAQSDSDAQFIEARAGKILDAANTGEGIEQFFAGLMEDITAEGRIQKEVYRHNPKEAQKKADQLENLKCDIVALAFADYLAEIIEDKALFCGKSRKALNAQAAHVFPRLSIAEAEHGEFWQAKLYFLLHLMPVEEAGSLRQQLKKWELVADKGEIKGKRENERKLAQAVLQPLDLYIAMHDAQFLGAEPAKEIGSKQGKAVHILAGDFAPFYEGGEADFCRLFLPEGSSNGRGTNPLLRELREIQRFGSSALRDIYQKAVHKISKKQVADWLTAETERKAEKGIAAAQKQKIALHEDWVKTKGKGDDWLRRNPITKKWDILGAKAKQYQTLVRQIAEHQQLTARVLLQDHLRLHRLLMAVLGRLIDFSGLWERDLYFALLAELYENGVEHIALTEKDIGRLERKELKKKWKKASKRKDRLAEFCVQAGFDITDGENTSDADAAAVLLAYHAIDENDMELKEWILDFFKINPFTYYLTAGRIVEALRALKYGGATIVTLQEVIKQRFGIVDGENSSVEVRNQFAHLAMLESNKPLVNLTREVNNARRLMAYDRKLKNAVSKAGIDLLEREKIQLRWEDIVKEEGGHNLARARLKSDYAYHLKKSKTDKSRIAELLHSKDYISMAEDLF